MVAQQTPCAATLNLTHKDNCYAPVGSRTGAQASRTVAAQGRGKIILSFNF